MKMFVSRLLAILVLFALFSCSTDKGSVGVGDFAARSEILDSMFAPPTEAERSELRTRYFGKLDYRAISPEILLRDTIPFNSDSSELWIVVHESGNARHYGAVLFPMGKQDSLPVLLFCHWGDAGVDVGEDVASVLDRVASLPSSFVIVIPSFRSEPLSYGDSTWVSTGEPSPWKDDVLDALRLVAAAESLAVAQDRPLFKQANRRSIGFSRGGGVALLASLHDSRIERVVDFFGPTDFYGEFVQGVVDTLLQGGEIALPGAEFLDTSLVDGLQNNRITMAEVRRELLLRSPARFAADLPLVQIQHGTADTVVPVSQAYALEQALKSDAPATYAESEVIIHEGSGHSPWLVLKGAQAAEDFLVEGFPLSRRISPASADLEVWVPRIPF